MQGHYFLLTFLLYPVSSLVPCRWYGFRDLVNQWINKNEKKMPSVLTRWLNTKYLKGRRHRVGKEAQWRKLLDIKLKGHQPDSSEPHKRQKHTMAQCGKSQHPYEEMQVGYRWFSRSCWAIGLEYTGEKHQKDHFSEEKGRTETWNCSLMLQSHALHHSHTWMLTCIHTRKWGLERWLNS